MDQLGLKVKGLRLARIDLKLIGPIAPNLAQRWIGPLLEWSTRGCSSTHNNTLQVLQRTALVPSPPKAGPDVSISVI